LSAELIEPDTSTRNTRFIGARCALVLLDVATPTRTM
jgi:hypothetical protein